MPKFTTGQSGNPAGRKRGVQNRLTLEARRILEANAPEVLQATVQSALNGDSQAQRLILGLALPKRVRAPLELPRLENAESALAALAILAERLAQGSIEPEEARALMQVVETAGRHFDAHARMSAFFETVLETVAAESPETSLRIIERLTALQAGSADCL